MKQFLRTLLFALSGLVLMTACSGGDEPAPEPVKPVSYTLSVTPTSIEAPIEGLEQVLTITTTAPSWKITIPEPVSWMRPSITTGLKGESTTKITIDENLNEGNRSTRIILSAPECKDITINISQKSFDEERYYGGKLYLEPDPSQMSEMTAQELVKEMGVAWNLGNTLEAPGGETAWGNVKTTPEIIAYVKALGFNTVRVPVSWFSHADGRYNDYHIASDWFGRVNEVIRYCLDAGMYVMINEHWDSDAFNNLSAAAREEQLKKAEEMWRQIAIRYRDYDYHLIFAGFNENTHNTSVFGGQADAPENYETQNLLLERFVKTVRETGGRNAYRYLAVQAHNTNIYQMVDYMRVPEDTVENRLLVECHLYTPWAFCGQEEYASWVGDEFYMILWDQYLPSHLNNSYYKLSQIESELKLFGDWCAQKGVGAVLGEFAATYHGDMATQKGVLSEHQQSRAWWHYHVARLCRKHAICPMLWDNGDVTTTKCRGGFIDRRNLSVADPATINALFQGYRNEDFRFTEK